MGYLRRLGMVLITVAALAGAGCAGDGAPPASPQAQPERATPPAAPRWYGVVRLGMSKDEVLRVVGRPFHVRADPGEVEEVWTYQRIRIFRTILPSGSERESRVRLYFQNDRLVRVDQVP
ncbi:MAG: hypothetical protein HYY96_12575 [Candidatus Tectomicrobia bacterium]|nr:hypothetical protein [Candidatus Tectomicrobia bacterium]